MLKLLSAIALFLALTKCGIYSQDPNDLFVDGKLPLILKELANPRPTLAQSAKIIAHQKNVKNRNRAVRRLRVAVIDNGVDYLHPALIYNTRFRIEEGEVVGAGVDVMGDDAWPHPNLIDASLFAFGAEDVNERGQVIGPVSNPLALYHSMNQQFMVKLAAAIRGHRILKRSLFKKINASNFTLVAAQIILARSFDSDKYYHKNKERKQLWSWNARSNKKLKAGIEKDVFEMLAKRYLDFDWAMHPDEGLPALSFYGVISKHTLMEKIKNADRFYELLQQTYQDFDRETGYEKLYEPYFKFCYARSQKKTSSRPDLIRDFSKKLHKAWFAVASDFKYYDPLVNFVSFFQYSLSLKEYKKLYEQNQPAKYRKAFIRERYQQAIDKAKQLQSYRLQHDERLTVSEKKKIRQSLERVDSLRDRFFVYMEQRGWEKFYQGQFYDPFDDALAGASANDALISYNPYLDTKSHHASHGTHVASTIVANDPRVDIEPVRVLTETKKNSNAINQKLIANFLTNFQDWLSDPLVTTAVRSKFARYFLKKSHEPGPAKIKKLQNAIFALSQRIAEEEISSIAFDLEFFDQLTTAIKYIGEHKIKLANISLGTKFFKANPPIDKDDIEEVQKDVINFLRYEYFKFKVALAVKTYAPHTLFFVAAGNSSGWFDGREKSGLPADISSPFLQDVEEKVGAQAINNYMNNIIAVISLKENTQYLSGFTDIPLSRVPTIMAVGDMVNGGIKLTDPGGAMIKYGILFKDQVEQVILSRNDDRDLDLMVQLGWIKQDDKKAMGKAARKVIKNLERYYNRALLDFSLILRDKYVIYSPIAHQRYRGTSMAAPNAAGFTARLILDQMTAEGLSDEEIYEHPDFTPRKIMKMVYAQTKAYGGYSLIREARKITDNPKYQHVPKIPTGQDTEYANYLRQLISLGEQVEVP